MSKLLTLRRPTTISKLIQELPEQAESRTLENIPQWSDTPPFGKLPDRQCPVHSTNLSRGALGKPIGRFAGNHGFDTQDPLLQITRVDYHLLHDKHLQKFFTAARKKNLKFHGLIDDEGKVKCSMKLLNDYRKFLYLQIRNNLQIQLRRMDSERKDLNHWHRVENYLNDNEDYNEKLMVRIERSKNIFLDKLNRWKDALDKYHQRIKMIAVERTCEKQQRLSEAHQRDLLNNTRLQELLAHRKRYQLILKRRLHERDDLLKQRITRNKRRNAELRLTRRQEHFRVHYMAYIRERNEAREMLEHWLNETEMKVFERKEMYRRQHMKLEEEMVRRKTGNLTRRYQRRSKKALMQALLHEYKKPTSDSTTSVAKQAIERAINAAYTIHATLSHTIGSSMIIETASQFISDLQENPGEPLPLDKQTVGYVVDRLNEQMELVLQETVKQALKLIEQVVSRKLERIDGINHFRSSLSNKSCNEQETTCSTRVRNAHSRVSLGPVSILEEYETDSLSFKKCKNRPPTPVTSVASMVKCTMLQTEEERSSTARLEISPESAIHLDQRIHSEDYPLIHIMYSQRRCLESNLIKYRKIVHTFVEQRICGCVSDLARFAVADKVPTEVEKDKLLHRTATALLKFPESAQDYASALLASVEYLSVVAMQKICKILNET
ncbi:hypothetical protein ZHAS_00014516 [Anopheles sinensis]|uniref:Fibrous sheath-interacting protein 2 n=1 Tax=Anopheles sinensis TaxID=74873 RepID=A0A084W8C0_ANOSI|nr:hypothetical protein ZHAS_00014516 [Anopheles sinensis]